MTRNHDDGFTALARLLPKLFRGGQAYVGVQASLAGLTPEQAATRPQALPHSVAELLSHVNWWLTWMLDVIEVGSVQGSSVQGSTVPYPEHAAVTWPQVGAADWERLRAEFYDLLSKVDTHTARPDLQNPVNFEETLGELLADFAVHTAYHFGQIVTVRQAIGAWPPPGGGDTW